MLVPVVKAYISLFKYHCIPWNHLNAWGKNFADCQFLKCSFGGFCGIACHLCDNEQSVPYLLGMLI